MWFNPSEITKTTSSPLATLATLETSPPVITTEWEKVAEVAKVATKGHLKRSPLQSKSESLKERQREASRQKAIAMLDASPDVPRAIYADEELDSENVVLFVASRIYQQTCELLIPKSRYDPWKLLELIEQLD